MTAKIQNSIRELKLDDIKTVAGGAGRLMASSSLYMSTATVAVQPTTTWSVPVLKRE